MLTYAPCQHEHGDNLEHPTSRNSLQYDSSSISNMDTLGNMHTISKYTHCSHEHCSYEHIVNMITSQHYLLVVGGVDMRRGLLHQEGG